MNEIKGTMLIIFLTLTVFGIAAGVIYSGFVDEKNRVSLAQDSEFVSANWKS